MVGSLLAPSETVPPLKDGSLYREGKDCDSHFTNGSCSTQRQQDHIGCMAQPRLDPTCSGTQLDTLTKTPSVLSKAAWHKMKRYFRHEKHLNQDLALLYGLPIILECPKPWTGSCLVRAANGSVRSIYCGHLMEMNY